MDKLKVRGGKPLKGKVSVGGAKNAALPVLISTLLTDQSCSFTNVPNLMDIRTVITLLSFLGVEVREDRSANSVILNGAHVREGEAPYDIVRKMRASFVVLGPLLARLGKARVSLPGGCAIGARPVNIHLKGLERLGAQIELESGYVVAKSKRLRGDRVPLEFPSVGATQNVLMAAALAKGETVLENCAREPEICDLAKTLRGMGAEIEGDGTATIHVQGKDSLKGCESAVMGDRIEAGTFLAAGLATGGDVEVEGLDPEWIEAVLAKYEETGAEVTRGKNSARVIARGRPRASSVTTLPFPGFPTDMQAQFMAIMAVADGTSTVTETIFENRFMHVPELCRLGANVTVKGKNAIVRGVNDLKGAPMMATDLRASASLIIGALCAQGESLISRIYHLDRGYENMEAKLKQLGADVERVG